MYNKVNHTRMNVKKGHNLSVASMKKKMHSKGTTPAMKKKLVFAMNARKWKMENGGLVQYMVEAGEVKPNPITAGSWGDSAKTMGTVGGITGMVGAGISAIDGADGNTSIGGQVAGGALSGAAMGMALGPIGAAVGGVLGGAVGGIKAWMGNEADQKAADAVQKQRAGQIQMAQVAGNAMGTGNRPTFAKGGMTIGQPNVELEKEEVSQAPDGSMMKFNLPSHANATRANQMAMQPGTRIFSDKLRTQSGKTIAEEADILRKEIQRYEQILNS